MATGDYPTSSGLYGPPNAYDPSKDPVRIAAAQALAKLKALGTLPATPPKPTTPNPNMGVWQEGRVMPPARPPQSAPTTPAAATPSVFTRSHYPTVAEAYGEPSAEPMQMPQAPAAPAMNLPAPLGPTDTEKNVAALSGLTEGAVPGGTSADVQGGTTNTVASGPANYMHWTTPEESAALAAQRAKYNVPEALAGLASANQYNNFTPGAFKPTPPSPLKVYNG